MHYVFWCLGTVGNSGVCLRVSASKIHFVEEMLNLNVSRSLGHVFCVLAECIVHFALLCQVVFVYVPSSSSLSRWSYGDKVYKYRLTKTALK